MLDKGIQDVQPKNGRCEQIGACPLKAPQAIYDKLGGGGGAGGGTR